MQSSLFAVFAVAVWVAVAAVMFRSMLVAWRRAMHEDWPDLLGRMMLRRGIDSAQVWEALPSWDVAAAGRRCALCAEKERCRAWLASGARSGYARFCANTGSLDRVAAIQRIARHGLTAA